MFDHQVLNFEAEVLTSAGAEMVSTGQAPAGVGLHGRGRPDPHRPRPGERPFTLH